MLHIFEEARVIISGRAFDIFLFFVVECCKLQFLYGDSPEQKCVK